MIISSNRRRKIDTKEKAMVAAVWATTFIQYLAVIAILYYDDFEK